MSFFELFQPGLRHLREERDRQKSVVANPKHGGSGGPLGIDLSGGTAKFVMPARPGTGEEESSPDEQVEGEHSQREAEGPSENGSGPAARPASEGAPG